MIGYRARMQRARRPVWLAVTAIALPAALIASVTACSSGASSGASNLGGAPNAAALSKCMKTANAAVAAASSPTAVAFPPAIPMKQLTGKTVWMVADDLTDPIDVAAANGFKAAAKAAGLKAKVFDGGGTVSGWNQGMAEAIAAHPAGIVEHSITPTDIGGELQKAKAAGIPVVGGQIPNGPGLSGFTDTNYPAEGVVMADFALSKTKCQLSTAWMTATEFGGMNEQGIAGVAEIHKLCPWCSIDLQNIDITTVATALGPQITTIINAHPKLNFVVVCADAFALYAIPSVKAAKRSVGLVSSSGNAANLADVASGQGEIGDFIQYPPASEGWYDLDQLARVMLNKPAAQVWEDLPSSLVTKANFATASKFSAWSNYQAEFEKTWGA